MPWQDPPPQTSFLVQALPSLQDAPLAFVIHAVWLVEGLHCWHVLAGLRHMHAHVPARHCRPVAQGRAVLRVDHEIGDHRIRVQRRGRLTPAFNAQWLALRAPADNQHRNGDGRAQLRRQTHP